VQKLKIDPEFATHLRPLDSEEKKQLEAKHIGRAVRYRRSDVEKFAQGDDDEQDSE
jgi:hypothetical protein